MYNSNEGPGVGKFLDDSKISCSHAEATMASFYLHILLLNSTNYKKHVKICF